MARPRIFNPDDPLRARVAINVYMYGYQMDWLKKQAHDLRTSPSALIRKAIQEAQEQGEQEIRIKRTA